MKKLSKSFVAIIVLVLFLVIGSSSIVSTYNDEYKLILQFGKVVKVIDEPGLSFKIPFIQTTMSIPNYEMVYDLVPSEVNTRDKKVMVTDSFALWSVTDPLEYLSRLGANKANAESRISVVVYNAGILKTTSLIVSAVITLFFPLLLSAVTWIMSRSFYMNKFRQYYAICAMCFAMTTIIALIAGFFVNYTDISFALLVIASIYYIVATFRINTIDDGKDKDDKNNSNNKKEPIKYSKISSDTSIIG